MSPGVCVCIKSISCCWFFFLPQFPFNKSAQTRSFLLDLRYSTRWVIQLNFTGGTLGFTQLCESVNGGAICKLKRCNHCKAYKWSSRKKPVSENTARDTTPGILISHESMSACSQHMLISRYSHTCACTPVLFKGPSVLWCMITSQRPAAQADQCLLITKGPKRWSIQLTRSRERERGREGCSRLWLMLPPSGEPTYRCVFRLD